MTEQSREREAKRPPEPRPVRVSRRGLCWTDFVSLVDQAVVAIVGVDMINYFEPKALEHDTNPRHLDTRAQSHRMVAPASIEDRNGCGSAQADRAGCLRYRRKSGILNEQWGSRKGPHDLMPVGYGPRQTRCTEAPGLNRSRLRLTRPVVLVTLAARLLFTLLVGLPLSVCAADEKAPTRADDLVAFFKRAISSPPDVEHFTVIQRTLRERKMPPGVQLRIPSPTSVPPQFFEGARSGTNYFLRQISETNALINVAGSGQVAGRRGSNTYHFSLNSLTYTYDKSDSVSPNPLVVSGEAYYSIVSQFLNMGLAAIQPGTITWNGYDFNAVRDGGSPVYGHLELSNGCPSVLSVSSKKGGTPFKSYTYVYPNPPLALAGFPERIFVSVIFEDGLHPFLELTMLEIRLAEYKLPEAFFSETRFITTNITYTNTFTNGELMSVLPGGKLVKANGSASQTSYDTQTAHGMQRAIVFTCIFAVTIGALLISLRFRKTK